MHLTCDKRNQEIHKHPFEELETFSVTLCTLHTEKRGKLMTILKDFLVTFVHEGTGPIRLTPRSVANWDFGHLSLGGFCRRNAYFSAVVPCPGKDPVFLLDGLLTNTIL